MGERRDCLLCPEKNYNIRQKVPLCVSLPSPTSLERSCTAPLAKEEILFFYVWKTANKKFLSAVCRTPKKELLKLICCPSVVLPWRNHS
jgi:hypothetical protein